MSRKLSLLVNFIGVDKMSGSLRNILKLGNQGSRSLGQMTSEGRRLEQQLRDVRKEMAGSAQASLALANRERELEKALRATRFEMEERKDVLRREASMRAQIAKGEELQQRGRDNMVQGATLAAPLILAAKAAGDFSSGMVDIQQKAGLTNKQTDRLQQSIITMAGNAKQLPENVRAGLDLLLAKGMGVDAASNAIGPASRLATAYKVDLPDAADAAFASINNLKVASADAAVIFDTLAAAGNEGGFEVRDMARHFPALTAQMAALGERGVPAVADLSAALQVAMNTAGNADEAGNNIKNLLGKINAPGTINAFKKNFGIDLPSAMQKLQSEGYSAMEAIAMITQQATGGDMKKLGFAFEDTQARMGLLALIQNLDEYRRVREAALNSKGTVDGAFNQRVLRDANVSWTAFMGSTSTLAITLGTTLLPILTSTADQINAVLQRVSAWAQANPEAASAIIKLIGAVAAFKIGLGALQFAFGGILKPLAILNPLVMKYAGSWSNLFTMIRTGAVAMGGGIYRAAMLARTAMMFMAKGVVKAGLMMLANPMILVIGATIAALGLLAYWVYSNWDKIKQGFSEGVAMVKSRLAGLPEWMKNIGKAMFAGFFIAWNPAAFAAKLISGAKQAITAFKDYLGIKSPSRLFMALGEFTTQGLAMGIERGGRRPMQALGRLSTGLTAAGAMALTPVAAAASAGQAGAAAPTAGGGTTTITINVYQQPGENGEALARRIEQMLDRRAAVAARGSYEDLE